MSNLSMTPAAIRARAARAAKAAAKLATVPATVTDTAPVAPVLAITHNPEPGITVLDLNAPADADKPVISDMPKQALPVVVAADPALIEAAVYASTFARAKQANGPNIDHAYDALKLVRKPAEPVTLTNDKPYAAPVDMGEYKYQPRKGDLSILVSTSKQSKDVWAWFDHVTGESGIASNWHVENIARGRVTAHMTASKVKAA